MNTESKNDAIIICKHLNRILFISNGNHITLNFLRI